MDSGTLSSLHFLQSLEENFHLDGAQSIPSKKVKRFRCIGDQETLGDIVNEREICNLETEMVHHPHSIRFQE